METMSKTNFWYYTQGLKVYTLSRREYYKIHVDVSFSTMYVSDDATVADEKCFKLHKKRAVMFGE